MSGVRSQKSEARGQKPPPGLPLKANRRLEAGGGDSGKRGGKRAGAGRKAALITVLKQDLLRKQQQEAEYAFAFMVKVMREPAVRTECRMAAAKDVMDRVWGKPNLKVELTETPKLVELDE